MKTVYLITGFTWPYRPEIWRTKRLATKRAALMRKNIRKEYALASRTCGIVIEAVNPANYNPMDIRS